LSPVLFKSVFHQFLRVSNDQILLVISGFYVSPVWPYVLHPSGNNLSKVPV
jgi:hypothetical protein